MLALFIGIICALIALITQFPARWAGQFLLPTEIKDEAKLSGTIWKGRLSGLQGIGPVDFTLHPSHILGTSPFIHVYSQLSGFQIKGHARPGLLTDISLKGRVSTFSALEPRLAGIRGNFDIHIHELIFEADQCQSAEGEARSDILTLNAAQWKWQGPDLSGPVSCDQGDLLIELKGVDDSQNISISLRSHLSGRYDVDFDVVTREPEAEFILPLFGFQKRAGGYRLTQSGRWN